MAKLIGFTTQFYTLWSHWQETKYVVDSYGKAWPSEIIDHFDYIKNVSKSLDKVKEQYPELHIDENLRGQERSFSRKREEDPTPALLKFGKYCGWWIADLAKKDFGYVIWLGENARNSQLRQLITELPEMIAREAELAAKREAESNRYELVQSGVREVTFFTNPNYYVGDEFYFPEGDESVHAMRDHTSKHYARVQIAPDHLLLVMFDQIKGVEGLYPYNMGVIDGKAKKLKNKSFKLNLEVVYTERTAHFCHQYAIIK